LVWIETDNDGLADIVDANPAVLDDPADVAAATAVTNLPIDDTDGDGLIDYNEKIGWAITFTGISDVGTGGNFTLHVTSEDCIADTDYDGLTDLEEYYNCSNPRDVDTDAFYVFHYFAALQRKKKWDNFPKPKERELSIPRRYLKTYEYVGGANMSLIEGVAERCFAFYGPSGFVTHAILRAVTLIEDVIINSDPKISADDLKYEARGELSNLMERIGRDAAQGYRRLPLKDGVEAEAIREFVEYFYNEVFLNYCEGERAILRDRKNRFNAGITAWYHENWRKFTRQKED